MRRQSRLPTRGEREGREDQTAGQHARAAHSSDPSEAADGPIISICWNSFRSPFRVSPSRKSSPRRSGLPHSASTSEAFTIFRKLQSAFLIATSSALWRCSNYGTAMAPISTMAGFASGSRVPGDYEVADLTTLLRRDPRPLLDQMIQRVVDGFRLLEDLTDLERNLAGDDGRRRRADVQAFRDDVKGRVGAHSPKPRWRFPASTFRPGSVS
jgi:hypothetical protein